MFINWYVVVWAVKSVLTFMATAITSCAVEQALSQDASKPAMAE
jgi:hypothetical protein